MTVQQTLLHIWWGGGGKRMVKAIVHVMISTWKETMLLEGYSQENIQIEWVKTGGLGACPCKRF